MQNLKKLDNNFLSEFVLEPFSSPVLVYYEAYKRGLVSELDYYSYSLAVRNMLALYKEFLKDE